jgi:hypothetical protein
MMVGDNIYRHSGPDGSWEQLDSHHSNLDGTANPLNVDKDTSANRVLVSRDFFYFGKAAPVVSQQVLEQLGYKNRRGHRVFEAPQCAAFVKWLLDNHAGSRDRVAGDPFDFDKSSKRYSGIGSTVH